VESVDDWKIQYLLQSADMLEEWKRCGGKGLSNETFAAWILTLRSLASIAVHLIETHNFKYVLFGKLQSDQLEGRFGIYRQVNGASYFVSVRQILQAEKKLRVLNLMELKIIKETQHDDQQLDIKFSQEICAFEDIVWLTSMLSTPTTCHLKETDGNLMYYVAGGIGRSIVRL